MIEFYRPTTCESCTRIEAALQEMVIAHKVIVVEPDQSNHGLSPSVTAASLQKKMRVLSAVKPTSKPISVSLKSSLNAGNASNQTLAIVMSNDFIKWTRGYFDPACRRRT